MKSGKATLITVFFFLISYLILDTAEVFAGRVWFDSYDTKVYESSIDHFVILKIFLLFKVLLACICISYILFRFTTRKYWNRVIICIILLLPALYLAGYIKYKCDDVYAYLKSSDTIYEGRFFEFDPMLGKRAVKNARGYQDYWIKTGNNYRKKLIIDSLGFRISEQKYPIIDSSLMLYLGCSFTWGDGCTAEETYPYLLSKRIGAPYINAGQSAYGLGQMALLAERLIPAYRPKYVFVQYSPWLIQRSLSPFKPTVFLTDITFPYIVMVEDSLTLKPPPFEGGLLSFDSEHYRTSPTSLGNRFHFYYDYGVRVMLHDFILRYSFLAANGKSMKTVPAEKAELYLYKRIFDVAHRYGCKVYVIKMGSITDSEDIPNGLFDNEQVINTDSTLKTFAHHDPKTYGKFFYHWAIQGKDSIIADVHPNPYAHSIIANEIYSHICAH